MASESGSRRERHNQAEGSNGRRTQPSSREQPDDEISRALDDKHGTMPRYLIYSEGQFGTPASKTANSVIRYSGPQVTAVIDSQHAGKRVADVLGFGGDIPIVDSVDAGIALGADALLVGVAMHGAGFPDGLASAIRTAIDRRLDIWNGLHLFVGDDPELAAL